MKILFPGSSLNVYEEDKFMRFALLHGTPRDALLPSTAFTPSNVPPRYSSLAHPMNPRWFIDLHEFAIQFIRFKCSLK